MSEDLELTWTASLDAVSYKIYRAVKDQAIYELVADHVTEMAYAYVPSDLKHGDQVILCVTAVNADGIESDGVRLLGSNELQTNKTEDPQMGSSVLRVV